MRSNLPECCFQCITPHNMTKGFFTNGLGNPRMVSRYMQGTWELKSVLVMSNAQLFKRGLPIYNRVREVPFDIPQGYMKGRSIYQWYVEEPHKSRDVVRTSNDSSYA